VRNKITILVIVVGLVLAGLAYGFLTMTDPPPRHPVPEGSPAHVGEGEVPEISPPTP
jgi:hypothetical protein